MKTTWVSRKLYTAIALVILAAFILPVVALADNVHNSVVVGGNDTITAGGSTTISYWISATGAGNDGQSGCNAADGSSAVLTINVPSGVTASTNSLTFSDCGAGSSQSVIFSSSTAGNYNITHSIADSGVGTYDDDRADWTLTVNAATVVIPPPPADTIAPVISGMPANKTVEATSSAGAVASWTAPTATDAVDGSVAVNCTPASGSTFALGGPHTVTCTATDAAQNQASETFTVTVRDTTAPVIAPLATVTAEATSASGATVTYISPATSDAVDGAGSATCLPASGSVFALGATEVTCNAEDAAGNDAVATTFNVIVRDTTAPSLVNMPANVNSIATSSAGAVVNYDVPTASDLVDPNPAVSCIPASGSTFPLGTTTVTCTATDAAGNPASNAFTVTVQYADSGVLQPINADGSSVFKAGSTVPVKFKLTGPSAGISNAVATITVHKVGSGISGDILEEVVSTSAATTGNLFRYDASSDQYIFNLNTKALSGQGTYRITINLGDGTPIVVNISLKK